jgi:hypothetical protein
VASGNLTQWPIGTAFKTVFQPGYVDAVWRNRAFLGLLHPITGQPIFPLLRVGDSSYRWKIQSAGNTNVAVFTAGSSAAVPVAQTYVNAAVSYTYFWGWIRVDGMARDAVRNASEEGLAIIDNEFLGTQDDIRDLMNVSFLGSSYSGLEVAIDSATTYAGIARGSAGYHESSETAHNAALTKAALADICETSEDNDKGGHTDIILAPRNQLTNYDALTGVPNAANSGFRSIAGDLSRGFDVSAKPTMLSFQGHPMVGIPDMTNEVICGLDLRQTKIGPNWGLSINRDFDVRGPDMSGDDDVYEVSCAGALICHLTKYNWKLTGVTA